MSQAVATAQQAQTAWEWLIENWRFVVGVGFLGLFLVACFIAWRAMQHVEEERVMNARTGANLRI